MIRYVWDESKNKKNQIKHGISFEEASSVFEDDESIIIYDEEHSIEEDRFIIIGLSLLSNVLVVCHCYLEEDTVIRIISARKASLRERDNYINKDERLLRFLQRKKESLHKTSKKTDHNKPEQ